MVHQCPTPESNPGRPAEEQSFDGEVEALLQHAPGVERALQVLSVAQAMDASLREQNGVHPLSRRFVIYSAGSAHYPFPHYRVELAPKHRGMPTYDVEGIMLRFAVCPDEQQGTAFAGALTVTYGLRGGVTADHVLTDTEWEPYAATDELRIEDGVLAGVRTPLGASPFRIKDFSSVIDEMEPALQDNTVAT